MTASGKHWTVTAILSACLGLTALGILEPATPRPRPADGRGATALDQLREAGRPIGGTAAHGREKVVRFVPSGTEAFVREGVAVLGLAVIGGVVMALLSAHPARRLLGRGLARAHRQWWPGLTR